MAETAYAAVAWLTEGSGLTIYLTAGESFAIAAAIEVVAATPCDGPVARRSAQEGQQE